MRVERDVLLLFLSVGLINSDQNLLAPNLSAAAAELGLADIEKDEKLGGGLAVGLFLVGGPAALLVGAAADGLVERVTLLAAVLAVGACGCAGSALAPTYGALWVSRAVTGVSLGGGLPLTFSLVGDMYPPAQRVSLSGRIGLAISFGQMGGQGLAGLLGPSVGWRVPFALVACCLLCLALTVRRCMVEPPRRREGALDSSPPRSGEGSVQGAPPAAAEEGGGVGGRQRAARGGIKPTPSLRGWASLLRVPTVWLVLLQGVPGCVPWGVIGVFLPDYLHADVGYSVRQATLILGCFALGGTVGVACGGEAGQLLYNRSKALPALLALCGGAAGVVPMWYLVSTPPRSLLGCCALAATGGVFATLTGPIVRATLTNVTRTEQRGVAFAAFTLADDVGKGAGPAAVALLVRRLGRRRAFAAAMLMWLPCAALVGMTACTAARDEATASRRSADGEEEEGEALLAPLG